jgi:hypothetical protein
MASEDLWRAALHDFNNLLAGLQGVLDLSDPRRPMDPRNRQRMEASLEDGKTLITMARALALGRIPDEGAAPWPEWKGGLEARLAPLATLFQCPIDLVDVGAGEAPWPTPHLQDWAAAFTRQVLPWVAPGPLRLEAAATPEGWTLLWVGDASIPAALRPDPPQGAPANLASLWLRATAQRLGISLQQGPDGILARMERPCGS